MFEELKNALAALAIPIAEFSWDTRPDTDYMVITLDGEGDTVYANDKMEHQAPRGTIDLYSKSNDRSKMLAVQNVLNNFEGCAWYLNTIMYEDDTQLLHWEFAFDLVDW